MLAFVVTPQAAVSRSMTQGRLNPFQPSSSARTGSRLLHTSSISSSEVSPIQARILQQNALVQARLGKLKPLPGSKIKEKIIGMGKGSGRGKTSTYGHKGRTARQGGEVAYGFEGGQTPYYKRMRKFGFTNRKHKIEYAPLNLSRLQFWIDSGRIDPSQTITIKTLLESGCVGKLRKLQAGIKLLGEGAEWFKGPINIEVSQASESALNAIKSTGGSIKLVYYNATGLRALLKPEKFYPHTERRLPYLTIPRANINRKLIHPMEQPDQFPGWVEAQAALKDAIAAASASAKASESESAL